MKLLIILFLVILIVAQDEPWRKRKIRKRRKKIVSIVNKANKGWKATTDNKFARMLKPELKKYLGEGFGTRGEKIPIQKYELTLKPNLKLPKYFDERYTSRYPWRRCRKITRWIRNQGSCGSCWAFAGTGVMQDRWCLRRPRRKKKFSPQWLVSCDTTNFACNGGYLSRSWKYIKKYGVCTEQCFPYSSGGGVVESCPKKCKNGKKIKRYKIKKYYKVGNWIPFNSLRARFIQRELYLRGSVEMSFKVYEDFFQYKSGVYEYVYGDYVGGHAVRLIGWGKTKKGKKYWIIANSWGKNWGINGVFYIRRGVNEVKIETRGVWGIKL